MLVSWLLVPKKQAREGWENVSYVKKGYSHTFDKHKKTKSGYAQSGPVTYNRKLVVLVSWLLVLKKQARKGWENVSYVKKGYSHTFDKHKKTKKRVCTKWTGDLQQKIGRACFMVVGTEEASKRRMGKCFLCKKRDIHTRLTSTRKQKAGMHKVGR